MTSNLVCEPGLQPPGLRPGDCERESGALDDRRPPLQDEVPPAQVNLCAYFIVYRGICIFIPNLINFAVVFNGEYSILPQTNL